MRVGLVGLGNIGTAIANLVATNGYPVVGWEYSSPKLVVKLSIHMELLKIKNL